MTQGKNKDSKLSDGVTEVRKREHIETILKSDVVAKGVTTGFEQFAFEHCAMPEIDLDRIDLSIPVFGKTLQAPILISSMTGGVSQGGIINRRLAECAQALGLAMGLGSQRAGIEQSSLAKTYKVRDVAPDILLFANFFAKDLHVDAQRFPILRPRHIGECRFGCGMHPAWTADTPLANAAPSTMKVARDPARMTTLVDWLEGRTCGRGCAACACVHVLTHTNMVS